VLKSFVNGAVFGERFGSDDPQVLAIHGWAHTHTDYSQVLAGLDAIAIDLPGFGASPPPEVACSVAEWAQMVAPVLGEFKTPCVLVGHSVGGRIAVHLAINNPEKVRGLVLIASPLVHNPAASTRKAPMKFRLAKRLNTFHLLPDAKMEALRKQYGSRDYRNASGVMRDILVKLVSSSDEEYLPSVKQHAHLVWAQDDFEAPLPIGKKAAEILPDAELTIFDEGGHLLPTTRADDVRGLIIKACAR
jgi:pimeloyl-ACP methyl ester carboxylesterase